MKNEGIEQSLSCLSLDLQESVLAGLCCATVIRTVRKMDSTNFPQLVTLQHTLYVLNQLSCLALNS